MSVAARFFPPGTDPYSRALEGLRRLVVRLKDGGWDEGLRERALERAAALATLRPHGKTRPLCRAIVSLLAIHGQEAAGLHASIGERLVELIDRLPASPSPRAS
ncbi:MAG TPA: hypothetical protein VF950_04450 [Planctomycetota bacterium]